MGKFFWKEINYKLGDRQDSRNQSRGSIVLVQDKEILLLDKIGHGSTWAMKKRKPHLSIFRRSANRPQTDGIFYMCNRNYVVGPNSKKVRAVQPEVWR